jgi:anti-anti-sigma regulatory factor
MIFSAPRHRIPMRGNILSLEDCRKASALIHQAIEAGHADIELDFSNVLEITGSFAGFLAEIIRTVGSCGGSLVVTGVNQHIYEILDLVGFSGYVQGSFREKIKTTH